MTGVPVNMEKCVLTRQLTQPHNPSATPIKTDRIKPFLVWNIHIHQDLIYIYLGHVLLSWSGKTPFSKAKHTKVSNK